MANIEARFGGNVPPRDLADHAIEDRAVRTTEIAGKERLLPGDMKVGLMCVSVEPGDRLGELFLNTQYEALPDEPNVCQAGQNRVMLDGGRWLRRLIEEIAAAGAGWEVEVFPVPCPKSDTEPPTDTVIGIFNGLDADRSGTIEGDRGPVVEQ